MKDKNWTPQYSKWRHGGWYVHNLHYPSGACGCVSNNYDDGKWRIACGDFNTTFPTRDAAARAEREIVLMEIRIAKFSKICRKSRNARDITRLWNWADHQASPEVFWDILTSTHPFVFRDPSNSNSIEFSY